MAGVLTERQCAQLIALHALLDRPEHVVEAITALDGASVVAVTKAAALKCHEELLQNPEVWDSERCIAAWAGLRRTQKVQQWMFESGLAKWHTPAPRQLMEAEPCHNHTLEEEGDAAGASR